ncbi:unnamed protein product [Arabidopsis lyrata]|uniref:Cysteine protease inhibitor WSCP-like n=1 Tax=Arabidopsis lyrata subsp. lyrata TaxID=81972 RepID=D7KZB7_ARALL|nr:cysteine protease inhibitor WSCP [Arabidopsis lyrata subsp. lyrata]EFH63685.1 hypothetical protein ARALYDRAFT_895079 [Arabidopsis lyrata subsp. lyrata]CAH8257925.1 unnamed protein product [Arabidopsis lyrata]|eukprot:XP_002887426.1 cysteine protease inhibitor WSCP [Arabidopsis lyrata subsp. lyrata]
MKKPSVISFLITLLLAAAVCIHGGEPVNDKDGNPVKLGELYFIQPVKTKTNNGGGLVPATTSILPPYCPLGITQTLLPYQPGLPVNFTLPDAREETFVQTSLAVNIEFNSNIWACNEFSKFWKVNETSSASEEPLILIGGTPQKPNSWFKIEIAGEGAEANTYKLTTSTGTVGTKPGVWFGAPQLVVPNDAAKPLLIKFKKVEDVTTATTSTTRVEKLGLRMFPF